MVDFVSLIWPAAIWIIFQGKLSDSDPREDLSPEEQVCRIQHTTPASGKRCRRCMLIRSPLNLTGGVLFSVAVGISTSMVISLGSSSVCFDTLVRGFPNHRGLDLT